MTPLTADEIEHLAQQRASAKLRWYLHAAVYVVVNAFLFAISRRAWGDRPWSVYPMLGWGVGLALHGVSVFVLGRGSGVREALVRRERERIEREQGRRL